MKASELRALAKELAPNRWDPPYKFLIEFVKDSVRECPHIEYAAVTLIDHRVLHPLISTCPLYDKSLSDALLQKLRDDGFEVYMTDKVIGLTWEEKK